VQYPECPVAFDARAMVYRICMHVPQISRSWIQCWLLRSLALLTSAGPRPLPAQTHKPRHALEVASELTPTPTSSIVP
jgi:hypothetical protein